jgi:hypothetical protein
MVWRLQYVSLSTFENNPRIEPIDADNVSSVTESNPATQTFEQIAKSYHGSSDKKSSSQTGDTLRQCRQTGPSSTANASLSFGTNIIFLTESDGKSPLLKRK